jgi:hypothetical protein
MFLEWLYSKRLAPINRPNTGTSARSLDLIRLYQFADKLCLLELVDYTMTIIASNYDHLGSYPSQAAMNLAYQITGVGSGLRSFMLHFLIFIGERDHWDTWDCETNISDNDILVDYLKLKTELISDPSSFLLTDPRKEDRCTWHRHAEGEACEFKEDILW